LYKLVQVRIIAVLLKILVLCHIHPLLCNHSVNTYPRHHIRENGVFYSVLLEVIRIRKTQPVGKAQKQFNSKLQTRFLVREDALKAERRNCQTKEEQDKIWSRVPKGGPIPRLTGRLTVGRKTNSNSNCNWPSRLVESQMRQ
jgi:hypothetical protein